MAQSGKFNTEIPRFTGDEETRWRSLENYLYRLEENLRFALARLERQTEDAKKEEA